MSSGFQHRPTLKQSNKPFKAKHRSKGELKRAMNGKVEQAPRTFVKHSGKSDAKQNRRNLAKQIQQNKRAEILEKKRLGRTDDGAPRLIALIALGANSNVLDAASLIVKSCLGADEMMPELQLGKQTTVIAHKFKSRMTLYPCPRELVPVLDIAKVADMILYTFNVEDGIDADGEQILHLLTSQGMPTAMGAVAGSINIPMKKRHDVKKAAIESFSKHFAEEPRVVPLDNTTDAEQFVRFASQQKLRTLWRERRPYMLVEQVQFHPNEGNPQFGTLLLSGYVRGSELDVNSIVHLTGYGDFQVESIEAPADPHPFKKHDNDVAMDGDARIIAQPDAQLQETLQTKNIPDETANEQTWPTEDELAAAELQRKQRKRRVPKGTSEYQAAWIMDDGVPISDDSDDEEDSFSHSGMQHSDEDEGEEEEDGEDDDDDDEMSAEDHAVRVDGKKGGKDGKKVRFHDEADSDGGDLGDDEMEADAEAEHKRRKHHRENLTEEEEIENDLHHPDEVDVPEDQAARFRFHKYRGLRSFRTSPWDPKENLPFDYAQIFQFENFKRTKKRVLSQHTGIPAGGWLTLHLKDVHVDLLAHHNPQHPLLLSGLLKYENKMSVVNFSITKAQTYPRPLRNKEELWFHVGFRRFKANPLFSENAHNSDKFKMLRFIHEDNAVATIYAPITFPPMPVLIWKELQPGRPLLAATGGVMDVNPDRIVLKKIILTGKPFRVRNRRSVVRDMFYNPDDIKWFKPIELWTKRGLTGHITEPLGTHGYMKCTFSAKLDHGDTVCMSLYKRVFPGWATMPNPPRPYPIPGDDVVHPEKR